MLKSANRTHYTESSGIRIRAFVEDAENFLEMCGRPRDRWARFIISWLGPNAAEKVRCSHFVADYVDYSKFCEGLFSLFGRLDFEDSYRQQLRVLVQSGAESVAAFASRTTDLSTRAYPDFTTDLKLELAVDHFISGLRDASSRDYLRRDSARRLISWQDAGQMAQVSEVFRAAEYMLPAAAVVLDAMYAKTPNLAHSTTSFPNDCAMSVQTYPGNSGNSRRRGSSRKSRDTHENAHASFS